MSNCTGNGEDHCCWIDGMVCIYLEEYTVPDRHWACGLLRKYGSWEAMYHSPEYKMIMAVAPASIGGRNYRCGDWPYFGQSCNVCGVTGG